MDLVRTPRAALAVLLLVVAMAAPQRAVAGEGAPLALPRAAGEHPSASGAVGGASADARMDIGPLPVPYYSQRDERWGCDQLGTCTCDLNTCRTSAVTTMADAGCYPTAQAMVFAYYAGGAFMDPGAYNRCLLANGGYAAFPGACASGVCGAADDPPAACRPPGLAYLGPSLDKAVLDDDLANGHPAIAVIGVGVPGRLPHAVVVTGKSGGNYTVRDPYYDRAVVSPGEIYGFHRWRGPGVSAPPAATAGLAQAAAGVLPGPSAGDPAALATQGGPIEAPRLAAAFSADVTVPDGAPAPGGRTFTKTWAVRNPGPLAWPEGTRLVHVGGERLGVVESVAAPALAPGEAGRVSVPMRASRGPGVARSDWRLAAPDGTPFGPALYVEITVQAPLRPERRNWAMFEQAYARGRL
jgi:hypothetical protein